MTTDLTDIARARRLRALSGIKSARRRARPLSARLFGRATRGMVGLRGTALAA